MPKFFEKKEVQQKTTMEKIFNDILMDLKLANHVIKKEDPERADWVIASILHEADLSQVSVSKLTKNVKLKNYG